MRFQLIGFICLVFLLTACRSLGELQLQSEQISISIAERVLQDQRKIRKLRKLQTVETVHRYLLHRLNKMQVRSSLKFDLVINSYRIGFGRDHIGVKVTVSEHGNILQEFDELETTGRGSPTKKLSKGLARRIYKRIQDL